MSTWFLLFALSVGLAAFSDKAVQSPPDLPIPRDMERLFAPPPELTGQYGDYRSPLLFRNGARVQSAAEWPRRRSEILHDWQELMGPWPALLKRPKLEVLHESRRENFVQKRVRLEIAPNQSGEGWLLVPDGKKPLLLGDLFFMVNDSGVATCLDAKTGAQVWQERVGGSFSASPVCAEGRIYLFDEQGRATVLKAGRRFEKIAENRLSDGFLASPVIAGRAFFLRTKTHLYRIERVPGK